jgi:hypothetical protein
MKPSPKKPRPMIDDPSTALRIFSRCRLPFDR